MFGISKLLRDKKGVGAIEYALVAGMISLAAYSGYCNLGNKLHQHYDKVDTALSAAL
jgi:Flp pilus assembly pilin Flp